MTCGGSTSPGVSHRRCTRLPARSGLASRATGRTAHRADEIPTPPFVGSMGPTLAPCPSRLARRSRKSAVRAKPASRWTGLLVLRGSRGKSAPFVLSTQGLAPGFWSCVATSNARPRWPRKPVPAIPNASSARPRQLRERGREHHRHDRGLRLGGAQPAALDAMCDEVVRITPPPGGSPSLQFARSDTSVPNTYAGDGPRAGPAQTSDGRCDKDASWNPQMLASSGGKSG